MAKQKKPTAKQMMHDCVDHLERISGDISKVPPEDTPWIYEETKERREDGSGEAIDCNFYRRSNSC